MVYPDIRSTLCYLFEKSGFKNVNLEKEIDFEKLRQKRKS
jgi:preprotein translocase subunit SecB